MQAYSWLSVAKANGNQMASKRIDSLIPRMTNEQIAIGQEVLAGELFEEIAKGIEESPVHTKFDWLKFDAILRNLEILYEFLKFSSMCQWDNRTIENRF